MTYEGSETPVTGDALQDGDLQVAEEESRTEVENTVDRGSELLQATINMKNQSIYDEACRFQQSVSTKHSLEAALRRFEQIPNYRDSQERAEECRQRLGELKVRERQQAYEKQQARKRTKIIKYVVALAAVVALIVMAGFVVNHVEEVNEGRAARIEQNLVGMSFKATYHEAGEVDQSGSWGLAREWTEYEVTYCFGEYGTITVDTWKRYDKHPFTTVDGVRQWDSVTHDDRIAYGGNVEVTFFGDVTVTIDGVRYELTVGENDIPTSLVVGDTTYEKVEP